MTVEAKRVAAYLELLAEQYRQRKPSGGKIERILDEHANEARYWALKLAATDIVVGKHLEATVSKTETVHFEAPPPPGAE